MDNFIALQHVVNGNNGHLYNYGSDGLIVTNLSGREIIHVSVQHRNQITLEDIQRVKLFFSDLSLHLVTEQKTVEKTIIWIDVDVNVLFDFVQKSICIESLKNLAQNHLCVTRIHFDQDPILWPDILTSFHKSFSEEIATGAISLQLHGPFAPIKNSVMEFLFTNRFQIYYVIKTKALKRVSNCVSDLSEYGFRVPCVWYVDKKNIGWIPALINQAMRFNYYAGFCLPLSTEKIVGHAKDCPSSVDYIRLIIEHYQKYQCFDDVFYPMNTIFMESTGVMDSSKKTLLRWDKEQHSFYDYCRDTHIEHIHLMLRRAFIWQRWIFIKKFIIGDQEHRFGG